MSLTPTPTTHECAIPPISSTTNHPSSMPTHSNTSLSFALPTSLAFFKRLTWEQTPWTSLTLLPHTARIISTTLSSTLHIHLNPLAIQHALCIGVAYDSATNKQKADYPHLFIIFPHLTRDVSRDEKFLEIWHDQIVKPAFDEAWRDSGLVTTYGRAKNRFSFGQHEGDTKCNAVPATDILTRLANSSNASVHAVWPSWDDAWKGGQEGRWSDKRAEVLDEAWISMTGMLDGHSDLKEMQDPILLAVWGLKAVAGENVGAEKVVEAVGRRWDGYADSRFVIPRSFSVHLEP